MDVTSEALKQLTPYKETCRNDNKIDLRQQTVTTCTQTFYSAHSHYVL